MQNILHRFVLSSVIEFMDFGKILEFFFFYLNESVITTGVAETKSTDYKSKKSGVINILRRNKFPRIRSLQITEHCQSSMNFALYINRCLYII